MPTRSSLSRCAVLAAISLAACVDGEGGRLGDSAAAIVANPVPDVPTLLPPIHLMEAGAFKRPTIPPYRTTSDGRVALSLTKVNGGANIAFGLYAPEQLTTPWVEAPAGVIGLAATQATVANSLFYAGPYAPAANDSLTTTDHRTICNAWPVANPVKNPYPCANDATRDCYDITVVSTYRVGPDQIQLHGKPIRVQVANPKTATPTIAAIDTDAAVLGAPGVAAGPVLAGDFALEPMITDDGHLLVMRLGDFTTTNPVTLAANQTLDIVYLAATDDDDLPCDVTQWTAWWPITHAHFDNAMTSRYGFAKYPLRDAKGTAFTDGEDLGGSYPWIDRQGDNLFFTMLSSTLWYEDTAPANPTPGPLAQRYADTCVVAGCNDPVSTANMYALGDALEADNQFRGFALAGLWSRGKTVLLDNIANNTDYGLGRDDLDQRNLALYASGGAAVSVRVGSGRDNGGPVPLGAVDNTAFIDSWENLFNHDLDAKPTTVRDVVWTMNTGKASVELAFDDYLDGDAIIVSDGAAASTKTKLWKNQPTYLDGFVQTGERKAWYTVEAELQNAATPISSWWAVPPSGVLEGNLRIEPVALGGIVGKGLWLPGTGQQIRYDLPSQATARNLSPSTRTISLMLDPRFTDDGVARPLMRLADGTDVELLGLSQVRYTKSGNVTTVSMVGHPLVANAWNHLAWIVTGDGTVVDLYRDGYKFKTSVFAANRRIMNVVPRAGGTMRVGGWLGGQGFRGWIDDIKVFARAVTPETMCNLGRGTLVRLTAGADPSWDAVANRYSTHGVLRTLLGDPAGTKYVCFHDYADPEKALLAHLPTGATAIHALVQFPEGPLHAAAPRPVSATNKFCLGCHVDDGTAPPSLTTAALLVDTGGAGGAARPAQDDPRRQPMQTPPLIFGNVPANYFSNGNPASLPNLDFDAPALGTAIDPYVIP